MGNVQLLPSTGDNTPSGPEWTLGDRLGKSLRYAGMKAQDMADIIGVARNTISNYVNDHTEPSKLALKEWALRTGVSVEWLEGNSPSSEVTPVYFSQDVDNVIPFPVRAA